jgi:hypothetical protein
MVVAVLAAGCGGTSKTGSASGAPAGASIAPASAIAFVSLNTDASSTQWKNADALLNKFPSRDKLLAALEHNLALSGKGTNFNTDVLPLLGPELDLVVLDGGGSAQRFVGFTQPTDAQKLDAQLEGQSPPMKHMELGGWTIFSDAQASLDAFKSEAAKGKLADSDSFKRAIADLPTEANATAYLNGTAVTALKSALPQAGAVPTGKLDWVGAALSSQSDSIKVVGAIKSGQLPGQTFKPTLLAHVPSGALLVASFRGGDQLRQQLTQTPAVQQRLGQVQQLLGVSVDQIAALVAGEGVLYVSSGVPYPEVTLLLHQSDPSAAATTLNKLVARVAAFVNAKVTPAVIPGVKNAKQVTAGPVAIYFGIFGGNLVISDSASGFHSSAATPITDDPVFQKTSEAAGRPDQSAGFLYVNIKDSVPLIQGLAQLSGATIPPDVSANLAPLQSFLAYATVDNGVAKFTALLQVR